MGINRLVAGEKSGTIHLVMICVTTVKVTMQNMRLPGFVLIGLWVARDIARCFLFECSNDSPCSAVELCKRVRIRIVPKFLGHVMKAFSSARPNCSHRRVSLKKFPLELALILTHATNISTEQTSMRTKLFKHIAA